MKARGNRAKVTLITKVGSPMGKGKSGLSARYIDEAVEQSLRRLKTDVIDLYLSHWPDMATPVEETLGAHQRLIEQGKIRWCGASNLTLRLLQNAIAAAKKLGGARYEVLEPEYNLYDRAGFEGPLCDLCVAEGLGVITYYSLARGFLSGKYRGEADLGQSARGEGVKRYLDPRGQRILATLDEVSARRAAKPAEVALAWLIQRRGVTAPIASATTLAQTESLIRAASLRLAAGDVEALDHASAP
jgi:aryl-alcohol dehydrogenase-like predicted oxidoreductase